MIWYVLFYVIDDMKAEFRNLKIPETALIPITMNRTISKYGFFWKVKYRWVCQGRAECPQCGVHHDWDFNASN
jgi:hypothetical protein